MQRYILIYYHEIALKGRNQPMFINRLIENLREATRDLGVRKIFRSQGFVIAALTPEADWEVLRARIGRVFGVANFSLAHRTAASLEAVQAGVERVLDGRRFASFRVTAMRSDKRFPLTSQQIAERVGGFVYESTGMPVRLRDPELTIFVRMLTDEAYVYLNKEEGPGGLPVGVSGRVVALLSGGIDSPVAALRMMKRGCRVTFVHFHSFPFVTTASQEKARELALLLARYQPTARLYLVPFGEVQQQIVVGAPEAYRVILYRRLMMRIAEAIAAREGAGALVTGESLGQVASQTLDNLTVIEDAATLPILRPLIGMDKAEIVAEAERAGTYPVSIVPDQDCCTLFTPRRPATHATIAAVREAEAALDLPALVALGLEHAEVREVTAYQPEPARVAP